MLFGDMTLFEAINHSLTTLSTGGFGTDGGSLGSFSSYTQWVVIVFMVLAGTSFALHYRALRDPKEYLKSHEFKLYMAIMGGAAVAFAIGTRNGGAIVEVIRDSVFTAVSLVTTTGYATADFGLWAPALQVIVFGLMFVGGMAGSTGGSVTPYRLGVLTGAAKSDLRRVIHPRGVFVTRLGGDTIDDEVVETVQSFFLLYMFIFMTGTLLFAIIAEFNGGSFDMCLVRLRSGVSAWQRRSGALSARAEQHVHRGGAPQQVLAVVPHAGWPHRDLPNPPAFHPGTLAKVGDQVPSTKYQVPSTGQ